MTIISSTIRRPLRHLSAHAVPVKAPPRHPKITGAVRKRNNIVAAVLFLSPWPVGFAGAVLGVGAIPMDAFVTLIATSTLLQIAGAATSVITEARS
jgi:hypothetical protein